MREYIKDRLETYIQDKIDYIKRENDVCGFDKVRYADLLSLEILNQSNQEKEKIVDNILDDTGLEQAIDEVINYYFNHR